MDDGYRLPLRRWSNSENPRSALLAVHGFNDYGQAFAPLGTYLAERGVLVYAYDQRGFGATNGRGRWPGKDRLVADLRTLADLLRKRHASLPLYLLGESMGGAVVMAATARYRIADGIILVAPAVWSRGTMNPLQRAGLWVAAHTVPWLAVSGRGIDIRPSDNLSMLRDFSADPLVIKATRIDALWGVTNIMDLAAAVAAGIPTPALLLYGENDEIIPKRAICTMLQGLDDEDPDLRLVVYREGWHMLMRDLQGDRVMADIAAWLGDQDAALPSGEESGINSPRMTSFCGS
jgi:alpha-beta hydrolase superfamily lysophospholipase